MTPPERSTDEREAEERERWDYHADAENLREVTELYEELRREIWKDD